MDAWRPIEASGENTTPQNQNQPRHHGERMPKDYPRQNITTLKHHSSWTCPYLGSALQRPVLASMSEGWPYCSSFLVPVLSSCSEKLEDASSRLSATRNTRVHIRILDTQCEDLDVPFGAVIATFTPPTMACRVEAASGSIKLDCEDDLD